jgi:2-dehydro-3-deoxygalactonokinase
VSSLIGIDWGTSSLRAALIGADGQVQGEVSLARGILTVPAGGFAQVLHEATAQWPQHERSLHLACGMVGSRQGWQEAPYCPCPAAFEQVAGSLAWAQAGHVAIVPGLTCERDGVPDVMRGEETQVFGALSLLGLESALLVLPGTHSKWVRVQAGRIVEFSTFMTGEFYALLRQHSILARTLPQDETALDAAEFERGVRYAMACANLLHAAFSARTLSLFDRMPPQSAASYLSGLVIGEELRSQHLRDAREPVVIVGSEALTGRYGMALRALGVPSRAVGSEATWRGLWTIAQHLGKPV